MSLLLFFFSTLFNQTLWNNFPVSISHLTILSTDLTLFWFVICLCRRVMHLNYLLHINKSRRRNVFYPIKKCETHKIQVRIGLCNLLNWLKWSFSTIFNTRIYVRIGMRTHTHNRLPYTYTRTTCRKHCLVCVDSQ